MVAPSLFALSFRIPDPEEEPRNSAPALASQHHFLYDAVQMSRNDTLGEFEHIVLLAIVRLSTDAYGSTIRRNRGADRALDRDWRALYRARPAGRKG